VSAAEVNRGESVPTSFQAVPFSRTLWIDPDDPTRLRVIDQRQLPHALSELVLGTVEDVVEAIKEMAVRGAGCIGVTAAWGMYLAALQAHTLTLEEAWTFITDSANSLVGSRPTAVNLSWAVTRQLNALRDLQSTDEFVAAAKEVATEITQEDIVGCRKIGRHGLEIIREVHERKGSEVNILTHCNAGWLAFVEYGSALAPIYAAHEAGIPVRVYVGESRPRSQGLLTAWELQQAGVPHVYTADNASGNLLQEGKVDLVIVGADRVTSRGDVANKVGTYLRALAARANDVPFYVAMPISTFDPDTFDGLVEIPIEEREGEEVTHVVVSDGEGAIRKALYVPGRTEVSNPAFDVTPAELVSAFITERGIVSANELSLKAFAGHISPERSSE